MRRRLKTPISVQPLRHCSARWVCCLSPLASALSPTRHARWNCRPDTEFDEMPRPLAALDLPRAHVMSRPCRLMPVASRPVAPERYRLSPQAQALWAAKGMEAFAVERATDAPTISQETPQDRA